MSDLDNDLMNLTMLRVAVQCYLSLHHAASQGAEEPDEEAMEYWLDEMNRLADA